MTRLLLLNKAMILEKGNVKLRAVEPADLENLYLWENDDTVWKVSQTISPFSRYTLKEYILTADTDIHSAKQLRLMIDVKEPRNIVTVGMVDLFDYDSLNRRAGIGILIGNTEYRQKGIAALSVEILLNYCFNILNLHQIHCFVGENNLSSIGLFKKLDFQYCGIIKDWLLHSNTWENVCFFQKINDLK